MTGVSLQIFRNVDLVPGQSLRRVVPDDRLVLDRSIIAAKHLAFAGRNLDRDGVSLEPILHHLDRLLEIGAGTIHLVHEGEPGNAILVRLTPDRFRLGLDAAYGTEKSDGAVKDAERALDFNRKVDMTRGIDDVDLSR
jgi:hypothetical protein